jgi:hypothetical protein
MYPRCGRDCGEWERRVRRLGVVVVELRLSHTPRLVKVVELPPIFYLPTSLDAQQREWAICYLWTELRLSVLGEDWLASTMRELIRAIDPDTAA